MSGLTAYCGLECSDCAVYRADRKNDDASRRKVAEAWSRDFGMSLTPGDIRCEGCRSEGGALFKHCLTCEVRDCGRNRGVPHCAACSDYDGCGRLAALAAQVPGLTERLEALRGKG